MAQKSEKKYLFDGEYVTIKRQADGYVMVQPVDDHGKDFGEEFPVSMSELMPV